MARLLLLLLVLQPAAGNFWFKRGGGYVGHGSVDYDVPKDFSLDKAAWAWENPEDELFRHGPVIDAERNVYVATSRGFLRKFDADGRKLWSWNTSEDEGVMVTSPFLHEGRLFISSICGAPSEPQGQRNYLYSFDMVSGALLYKAELELPPGAFTNMDSSTVHVAEGVVLMATTLPSAKLDSSLEGNNLILGRNASNGAALWDFSIEGVVWNFMPSTPGDGSFLFASTAAVAQRRRLLDGGVIWRSDLPDPGRWSFVSTGGGTLGPNGVFYAEGNQFVTAGTNGSLPLLGVPPCRGWQDCAEGMGIIIAHRVEDGSILWAKRMGIAFGGWQYPTVATIAGRLTVVAPIGNNPSIAKVLWLEDWAPQIIRFLTGSLQWRFQLLRRLLGVPVKRNAVSALDAETGDLLWTFEEPPWDFWAAKGDEETLLERVLRSLEDPRREAVCGPDNWGIPGVVGDGTVIVGSGSTGFLWAIRDEDRNGEIGSGEVVGQEFGSGFLNNPALAPGMMAVAPCWGKMYVFKT